MTQSVKAKLLNLGFSTEAETFLFCQKKLNNLSLLVLTYENLCDYNFETVTNSKEKETWGAFKQDRKFLVKEKTPDNKHTFQNMLIKFESCNMSLKVDFLHSL